MIFKRDNLNAHLGPQIVSKDFSNRDNPTYENAYFDSREITKESIFIALEGENQDGADYISDAIANGSTCIIAPEKSKDQVLATKTSGDVDYFFVQDPLVAFGEIGKLARNQFSGEVIGVIGSVGKTTTKNMLYELGGAQPETYASRDSFNNETGVPLTLCAIPSTANRVIVELGESHFGDLDYITSIARPTKLVITNVAMAHIEYLENLEGVAKTMNESVQLMPSGSKIVIPNNLAFKEIVLHDCLAEIVEVGIEQHNQHGDFWVSEVQTDSDLTSRVTFESKDLKIEFRVPLVGKHFVENAAMAFATCLSLGDQPDTVIERMNNVTSEGHRMRVFTSGSKTVFDDCYNANPTSMKSSIDAVAQYAKLNDQLSIFFMGPMRELGPTSDLLHEDVAKYALDSGISLLVCIGQETKSAYELTKVSQTVKYFSDVKNALVEVDSFIEPYGVIGVKASRGPDPQCPALYPIVQFFEKRSQ